MLIKQTYVNIKFFLNFGIASKNFLSTRSYFIISIKKKDSKITKLLVLVNERAQCKKNACWVPKVVKSVF